MLNVNKIGIAHSKVAYAIDLASEATYNGQGMVDDLHEREDYQSILEICKRFNNAS